MQSVSSPYIVGIDEAGRGALAGPVVAAACILPFRVPENIVIGDSKQMTPEERETSFEWLIKNCVHGIGLIENRIIDDLGILAATELAMQEAVKQIAKRKKNLYLLVDGRDAFWFDHPHSSIIRGDQSEPCIGAASILAKVTRDRLLKDAHQEFSQYNFERHKGDGTPEHLAFLKKHGPSVYHRRSFLKNILVAV